MDEQILPSPQAKRPEIRRQLIAADQSALSGSRGAGSPSSAHASRHAHAVDETMAVRHQAARGQQCLDALPRPRTGT